MYVTLIVIAYGESLCLKSKKVILQKQSSRATQDDNKLSFSITRYTREKIILKSSTELKVFKITKVQSRDLLAEKLKLAIHK